MFSSGHLILKFLHLNFHLKYLNNNIFFIKLLLQLIIKTESNVKNFKPVVKWLNVRIFVKLLIFDQYCDL